MPAFAILLVMAFENTVAQTTENPFFEEIDRASDAECTA